MPQALRFKSLQEAVNAASREGVKGQSQVVIRTESDEEVLSEVLIDEATGGLVMFTKGAMADIV